MIETPDAEKTRKLHRANEAKRIMSEPLLQEFFDNQEKTCFEAFKCLPMGARLEEYQTVQHDILATERLKFAMLNYIQDFKIMVSEEIKEDTIGV